MADFEKYAPILKRLEGGFVNHPDDAGQATNMGVTLATYRTLFGKDKTVEDLKNMTDAEWSRIMRIYWDSCDGRNIHNQSIANLVADWCVNSGSAGRKGVQKAVGVIPDGIFGKKTLAALNAEPQKCVFCKIKEAREEFFKDIVRRKPSQSVFLRGWLNRLDTFRYEDN